MLTLKFHQSLDSPFETKQLLGLCHSHVRVRQFLRKYARFLMPLSPSSPPPRPSLTPSFHGDVGQLSQLASRPTVWDVHPVLQSAGKWWQAYLLWHSLTWKKGKENKKRREGWRGSQLHWALSSTADMHAQGKTVRVKNLIHLYSKKCGNISHNRYKYNYLIGFETLNNFTVERSSGGRKVQFLHSNIKQYQIIMLTMGFLIRCSEL